VRQTRGRAIAARKRALKERVTAFGVDVDPTIYHEHIWPKLAAVKLAAIMEVTGYSKGYCSTIRAGTWTPHISTWPALGQMVGVDVAELTAGASKAAQVPMRQIELAPSQGRLLAETSRPSVLPSDTGRTGRVVGLAEGRAQ
jgi:hypothetical protein